VGRSQANVDVRLSKLDQLHNAYQDALGLRLESQEGACVARERRRRGAVGCGPPLTACRRSSNRLMKCGCPFVLLLHRTGELLLEFTQIDAAQPGKPFSFAVQVIGDNDYRGE
jgi:hypothetical protein